MEYPIVDSIILENYKNKKPTDYNFVYKNSRLIFDKKILFAGF